MIAVYDAKQLEWRAVAHLSKDKVALSEIKDKVDTHTENQIRFKLPGWQQAGKNTDVAQQGRLIAKIFLFRAIFKGSAYAYSVDNDFKHIGGVKYWQGIIDKFYEKYEGIYQYHVDLVREATSTGQLTSGTGRIYQFEPRMRRGEMKWPENDIVNYPVQGFSADLMSLIRVSAHRRLESLRENEQVFFVNTVHDNLVLDLNTNIKQAIEISRVVKSAFQDCGKNYQKIYGHELLVPMDCDAKLGINYLWTHEVKL
jgi:DNA polymerase I-like protein with 3'-5' exonuclease and polymerase domains